MWKSVKAFVIASGAANIAANFKAGRATTEEQIAIQMLLPPWQAYVKSMQSQQDGAIILKWEPAFCLQTFALEFLSAIHNQVPNKFRAHPVQWCWSVLMATTIVAGTYDKSQLRVAIAELEKEANGSHQPSMRY